MKELEKQLHEETLELTTNIRAELIFIRSRIETNNTELALLSAEYLVKYLAKLCEIKKIRNMLKEEEE